MIIDDGEPDSPLKTQQPLPAVQNALDDQRRLLEDVPPPAYTGPSTLSPAAMRHPQAGPSNPLLDPEGHLEKGEPAGRRFLKAFVVAILICALFGFMQGIPGYTKRPSKLLPKDGKVLECRKGRSRWNENSGSLPSMSFEMPMPSEAFYLFARGAYTLGHVDVVHNTDWTLTDTVKVDIQVVTAHAEFYRKSASAGWNGRKASEGSRYWYARFVLCISQGNSALEVEGPATTFYRLRASIYPAFETVLPRFTQSIEDMHDDVEFGFLGLASTDGKIYAHSAYANVAHLLASKGSIEGDFVANHLEVVASGTPIQANITILADDTNNGTLYLKSSNAEINSTVALLSAHPSFGEGTSGEAMFDVVTRTTNAAVEVNVVVLPVDADVRVAAKTTNNRATLRLPHTFEGNFQLRSTNSCQTSPFRPPRATRAAGDARGGYQRRGWEELDIGANVTHKGKADGEWGVNCAGVTAVSPVARGFEEWRLDEPWPCRQ
ncbi:uncharacterized protein B0H18DRAFT_1118303 [Fomitopsis serialis]|uniref:uncharacterized protein n=1 Tax=Fomitopsis serialis TaxID=139415 RepID=UPI0020085A95|nr:uncharacterized protein B0H18DRAFT_1118303 [Neoantrodia serialis]KAH9927774.1 hypothetical protein B0H18DRAFT_1118303 [Neoantrodia serialis]